MKLPVLPLGSATLFHFLLWGTLCLACLVLLLIILSALLQSHADKVNKRRIARFQAWEEALPAYLYQNESSAETFGSIAPRDRFFFQTFLRRYHSTLGGEDAKKLGVLYRELGLDQDLPRRLAHGRASTRAIAAMEVAAFKCTEHIGQMAGLLDDPKPFVTLAAARALSDLGQIHYAPRVFSWVLHQEDYQQDRLLEILEDFGTPLLRWLEDNLGPASTHPAQWRFYALLVAGIGDDLALPTLRRLLTEPNVELQAAVLKAMRSVGDPRVWEEIQPFCFSEAAPLRLLAARAAGSFRQSPTLFILADLLKDPVYEVRHEAALALAAMGNVGWEMLLWVAKDGKADPFARDTAREQLEWGRL